MGTQFLYEFGIDVGVGIVHIERVALSLVFFGINVARPLYQSTWMLIFAFVVLFLPASVGALGSSLLQVNPRVEEAAQSGDREHGY